MKAGKASHLFHCFKNWNFTSCKPMFRIYSYSYVVKILLVLFPFTPVSLFNPFYDRTTEIKNIPTILDYSSPPCRHDASMRGRRSYTGRVALSLLYNRSLMALSLHSRRQDMFYLCAKFKPAFISKMCKDV